MVVTPGIVIAGTRSGVGKTSLALGIVAALRRRGLEVQPFKVGPDFLDPTYLRRASGRECYNLDPWMCGRSYVGDIYSRAVEDADIAVIEGVMGMYDGASVDSSEGSTADVAGLLEIPVVLLAEAGGRARSFGALVEGFARFEEKPELAGAVANRVGSGRHGEMLGEALESCGAPPMLGALPDGAFPSLSDRHLGLISADETLLSREKLDDFAEACEQHLDLDRLLEVAGCDLPSVPRARMDDVGDTNPARIALARDRAFHFYYPDNLEHLQAAGAELIEFSPLHQDSMPKADGLYLGGGYPEELAVELSANESMRESVASFCRSGRPVYAECGGLMYLCRAIRTLDGKRHGMCGVLPAEVKMLERFRALGYAEVEIQESCPLGCPGRRLRGHEFHYSQISSDRMQGSGWRTVYGVRKRRGDANSREGYLNGNVLASYIHLHFASCPEAATDFVRLCAEDR